MNEHKFYQQSSFVAPFKSNINQEAILFWYPTVKIQIHAITLFLAWGFFADLGIIFVRYFRHFKHYQIIHVTCFLICDIITILSIVFAWVYADSTNFSKHGNIGTTILASTILQHMLGVLLKFKIEDSNNKILLQTYTLKQVHRALGAICYILARVNIGIGLQLILA